MLNYHELRLAYHPKMPRNRVNPYVWGTIALITAITLVVLVQGCAWSMTPSRENIASKDAILCIMGEGESESYLGKIALANTILNRGNFKGICALKNIVIKDGQYYKRVSLKSKYYKRTHNELRLIPLHEYNDSKMAWEYVKSTHAESEWDATGWGTSDDIEIFKKQGWFKKCNITATVGNHQFYKCERK